MKGDPVEAAKGLRDFAKANPLLIIKGGVLDGNPISAKDLAKFADLESREVLLAKLAGAMQASLTNAVSLFAAPLAQTARLLDALRQKAEADPSILAGGAGTPAPAAEETADEAPVEEAPADEAPAEAPEAEASAEAPNEAPNEAPEAEASAEAPTEG